MADRPEAYSQFMIEICEALGLERVKKLSIDFGEYGDIPIVTATIFPNPESTKKLQSIIKKYNLTIKERK